MNENSTLLWMYIASKIIFASIFILIFIWSVQPKHARGNVFQSLIISSIFQLAPLIIRTAVFLPSFQIGLSIIILIVLLIFFVGYVFALFVSDKKQLNSMKQYAGNEIKVKDK